jgi:hypothetical protein
MLIFDAQAYRPPCREPGPSEDLPASYRCKDARLSRERSRWHVERFRAQARGMGWDGP